MRNFLIYAEQVSRRLSYTLDVLLTQVWSIRYELIQDREAFIAYAGPKINYSAQRFSSQEIHLHPTGLLYETGIRNHVPMVVQSGEFPVFYSHQNEEADFSYDPLSMCFYLLSRYEEYLPHTKDQHGRFPASASLAFQHQFLQLPVINLWLKKLQLLVLKRFPDFEIKTRDYQFQATYDIDLAWAFLQRGVIINTLGTVKNLIQGDWKKLMLRFNVFCKKSRDPFDTYTFIRQLHERHKLPAHFFFLLGDYGRHDKNVAPQNFALQQLIKELHQHYQVGIHPSYQSNEQEGQLKREIGRLEKITGEKVWHSRQHFLKLDLPQTYRKLLEAGIQQDYSMGYAAAIGFRAGIAGPFPWYDLQREEATSLEIHPFQAMDVTLKEYLNLGPQEALATLQPLVQVVKETGGVFSTLWHNSSFAPEFGWKGWREMYETLVKIGVDGTGL